MAEYETKKISVVFIIKQNNKFLFLKRAKTGTYDGYYMFPGGHVDKGETVLNAAVRELKEELNITVQPQDLVLRLTETISTHINLFFEVIRYQGSIQNNEPQKHSEAVFLTPENNAIHPLCLKEIKAISENMLFLSAEDEL